MMLDRQRKFSCKAHQIVCTTNSIEDFQEEIDTSHCKLQGTPASVFTALTQRRAEIYDTILNLKALIDPNELLSQLTHIERQLSCLGSALECCVVLDLLRQYLPAVLAYVKKHDLIDYEFVCAQFNKLSSSYEACGGGDFDTSRLYVLKTLFHCLGDTILVTVQMHYQQSLDQWYRDNTSLTDNQLIITAYKGMLDMLTVPDDLMQRLPVFTDRLRLLDQFLKKSRTDFVKSARYRLLPPIPPQNKNHENKSSTHQRFPLS